MGCFKKRLKKPARQWFFLVLAAFFLFHHLSAQAALLIWPTSLPIPAGEKAAALWLENRGTIPQVYQARIFSWSQTDGKDVLAEQEALIASPPLMQVEPGKRQLIRIISLTPAEPGAEKNYRVIVDELPIKTDATPENTSSGVQFRMRYSIPIFVYGQGLSYPRQKVDETASLTEAISFSSLGWRIVKNGQSTFLEIRNTGKTHVHLRNIGFTSAASPPKNEHAFTGYVLPGCYMQWPITSATPTSRNRQLTAILNNQQLIVIPHAE
ncbi:MAG: molecular chaperone [Oxalobacter sp.]|nr:molecular chaperone [Oxalobacter sp.]